MDNEYMLDKDGAMIPKGDDLKNVIFTKSTAVGSLLLIYFIISKFFGYLSYHVLYFRYTHKITLSSKKAINYLLDNHESLVRSTTFSMSVNMLASLLAGVLIYIIAKRILHLKLSMRYRPERSLMKTGAMWMPACFMANMIFSLMAAYFTAFMGSTGISIPQADFSVRSPTTVAIILQFTYIVIVAPILEECIYRGLVLGALREYSNSAAILLSALSFALMHSNIPQAVSAFATGVMFAVIAVNCGSVIPTITIHMLNNLMANYNDIASALGFSKADTLFSIIQVALGLVGSYVLFTRYHHMKVEKNDALPTKGETTRIIFTNPAVLLYLGYLVYSIIAPILRANGIIS